jgi:hypothetical protein
MSQSRRGDELIEIVQYPRVAKYCHSTIPRSGGNRMHHGIHESVSIHEASISRLTSTNAMSMQHVCDNVAVRRHQFQP